MDIPEGGSAIPYYMEDPYISAEYEAKLKAEEEAKKKAEEEEKKKKKEPGKLPPRPQFSAKNSRDAAADTLKKFFNRR